MCSDFYRIWIIPSRVAEGNLLKILKRVSEVIVCGNALVFPVVISAQDAMLTDPAKYFSGTSLQVDVGHQPYSIKGSDLRLGAGRFKVPDQHYQGSSTPYFVGLSQTFPLSKHATLSAQIEINPINNQYVLSIMPGYAFNSNIQVYAKGALVNAKVSIDNAGSQSQTGSTTGITVGAGTKYLWTTNWYGFVEANYVKMNSFNLQMNLSGMVVSGQADYSGYNIMAGVGYKF